MATLNLAADLRSLTPAKLALSLFCAYVLLGLIRKVVRAQTSLLRHIPGPWYSMYTHKVMMWQVMIGQWDFYIDHLHKR